MKKSILVMCVLCVAAALVCLAGCQSQKKVPQEIEIEKDTVTITLEENGTTGFTWAYTVEPQDALKLESDDFIPSNTDEKIAGAGGLHTFKFKANKAGEVTLNFENSRSWEEVEPVETKTYQLTIDDKLNISMKQ